MSSEKEEVELLYALKQLPDFECFPLPASWYEKYKIPPRGVVNPREFMESNYTMRMAVAEKDLPPLFIDEPQRGGELKEFPPIKEIPIEVRTRPFKKERIPIKLLDDNDPIIDLTPPNPTFPDCTSSASSSASQKDS
jgi:hypothetical protein